MELLSVTRNSTLYSLTISSFFNKDKITFYLAVDSSANKEKSKILTSFTLNTMYLFCYHLL